MLRDAGTEKINFAGGEPFLHPQLLGELCKASHELGMAVSIISNGSVVTQQWMKEYGEFVDVLGVSVDSFVPETNAAIGRGGDADNRHAERVLRVRDLCAQHEIKFKMNTVVCCFNWQEDMSAQVRQLDPERWKVFQVLVLRGENAGLPGDLRDGRPLMVSKEEFGRFVNTHTPEFDKILIPEPNNVMQNSYLLLDEELRFLDCSQGGKVPSESILHVGVEQALQQSGFDQGMFDQRGGVYNWRRDRNGDRSH
jgi:radical S-adenosyl methionine domain-containing protein 2